MNDPKCTCGHTASNHVDNCEQCFISECRCREFEEKQTIAEMMDDDSDNVISASELFVNRID